MTLKEKMLMNAKLKGYLLKKRRYFPLWQKRYFIMETDSKLSYYEND